MADSSDDDDFGQKVPPLHIYLKRVLDKYPEGGQILKELVQNADDAEAKKVIFLFDKSKHSKDQLWTSELRQFQGPALYAYNDAVFKPPDWYNIQHPEQSGKADELTKVGRFGLGFISVYHLTDLPCILSGNTIGFLDPREKHFNYNPHTKTKYKGRRGKKWKLTADLLSKFRGQFSPFLVEMFHCAESSFVNGHFDGTIFRFPLRTAASELSKNVYTDSSRVLDLFRSFETDSELSLLFLKHVQSIEVYERGHSHEQPRQLFKVHITPADRPHLTIQRQDFLTQVQEMRDFHTVTCLNIEKQTGAGSRISRFITVNAIKTENTSGQLKQLISDDDLKLVPWMGIAVQVNKPGDSVGVSRSDGRLFCFLPMPCSEQTGLPVHVHGYFGLGDNRRGIKWPDRESRHDKNAIWNKLLATEVFPDVYRKAVLASIERSKLSSDLVKPDDVYRAWPRKESIKNEWSEGVKTFLQMLRNDAIFYTDHKGGCWMKANEVYVNTHKNPLLTKILKHKGHPVAHLPNYVTASLRWAGVEYREVTPTVVRSCIQNDPLRYLSRAEKLQLIDYVTRDTKSDLTNLYLLPLQDGSFTMFSPRPPTVYIASSKNPSVLIPNAAAQFAASDMPLVLRSNKVISYTQLKNLEVDDISLLLQQALPSTWIKGTDVKVQWTPGCNKHPSVQWLTEMWNWLTKHQISLETFRSIPLIPMMTNRFLAKLQENRIIFRKQGSRYSNACLTEGSCLFLENVGAIVLRDDIPSYITSHKSLDRLIQAPNPEGVLNILIAHRQKGNIERCVTSLTARAKNELRGLFGQLRKATSEQKDILQLLPLFSSSDSSFMSAKQGVFAVPSKFFGIPVKRLKKCRIIIADSSDDNLVTLMGIHKESAVELLSNTILPAVAERFYNANESVTIMSWVLARSEYDDLVKTLKFIPTTADDKLVSPSELFEPSDQLKRLFASRSVFPVHPYSECKLLNHLKRVGLKTDSNVTSSDVLIVATEVTRSQEKGQADIERAKVLLNHIHRFPHLLSLNVSSNRITKPLYKFLEDLNWVPCEGSAPSQYPVSAGWYGNNNTLYSPRQVGLIETAMLQGSVVPLISMPGIRQELLNVFKWSAQLDHRNYLKVENVVLQLKNVAVNFAYPATIPAVSNAVHEIYGFLSRASDQHLIHLFPTMFTSEPWVWHGAGFTTPDKMALTVGTLHIDLKPYLFTVPDSIKQHDNLLTRMGVQQTFQESALNVVLSQIQVKHAGEHVCNKTSIKSDEELVHSILRYITTLQDFDSQTSDLLVPCRALGTSDICLHMREASRCLYVDEERLMNQILDDNFENEFDKSIIHKSISNDLAQSLGVQPLSHIIAPSEAINYGYELAGPHETPINAIKRNLDMYKKGVDIFKELIQNADDAGATKVKFLIDWRKNEETANNLLSDRMKACHGPSIWAYNDARFSKEDITNICSIAAQSKKHKLDKVGRFGLGFTSVYHLTDVPSVVSGPYVLICDPRTTHLGSRIQPGQPGIKLDLTNPRHHLTLKSYPNQFQPYNGIFGCNLVTSTKGFDHTLIRLPLRTRDEANEHRNLLAEGVFDSKDAVKPLLESLKKASSTLLLFTQNVFHVSVYELDSKNPCEMDTVMSVTLERMQQMPRSISGQDGVMKTERNLLVATSASKGDSKLPIPETTMIVTVTQKTYASNKPKKKCSTFIISSCMVQGEILELAETDEGRRAGVLPCGGVAAELVAGEGGLTPKPVDGKAFSYLPLEVSTGLPFHVNGNFLLQPNRRQLWSKPSSSKGEFEARWNICFIESVLSRALFNLLQDLQTLQSQNVVDARDFQSLWPRQSKCISDFCSFVEVFYHTLDRDIDAPTLIFNGSQWVAVKDCFFTEWNQSDSEDLKSSIKALLRKKLYPQSLVELDAHVVSSIASVGTNIHFDSNTFTVNRFLQEVFFEMLEEGAIESSHRDNIVLHLLDLRVGERKVTDYDDSLKTTDCIPYSPDNNDLASPDRLVNPFTLIGSLYSEDDILFFPHGEEYRKEVRLLSLKDLGMACDDLPWDDVCERAETISLNKGYDQKLKNLLRLMSDKLGRQDAQTAKQKERIQNAKFLPVLTKPDDYPSEWCKSDLELMSAASLYESKHVLLLGSVKPLLDEGKLGSEALNQNLKSFLGFGEKEVIVSDVINQLDILIKETNNSTQQTSSMAQSIYSFLQDAFCRDDVTDQDIDRLCSLKSILCEGEFRACQQFAFKYNGKSRPYLFEVPTDFKCRFETLLRRCGVKQQFEIRDYLQVLHTLKTEFRGLILTELAVRTAEAMTSEVVAICRCHQADDMQDIDMNEEMYVLDDQCILQKPSDLTYHDLWWVHKSVDEVYTHDSLSHSAAETIGIKTTRQKQIDGCSSSRGFESEFGQMEKLTDRLSNILRSYPHVSDVFKELLQNADDAGATEIHFVYDPRKHKSEKVISNDWAGVQNLPALCVYNDKSFTEADIKGIQKVGVGGKREDITTTGRFGIGFNAVYHLTDCPSFLSNKDTLCVFDPLLKYTERADKTCPGRRYNTKESFRKNFPDMMCGYLEDDFKGLEGTMFRFPLRGEPSEISKECFSPCRIKMLLDEFQAVSHEALLFLNNIKKITISCIDEVTNKLEEKYSTNATFSDGDIQKRAKLYEHVKLFKNTSHETIPSMCQVYSLVIQDSKGGREKWLVSQMLGFEGVVGIKGSEDRLPRGGAAALLSGVGSVLHRQYRAYCVLPLPIHTELPVHVNGMFELDSSRRNLSKGDDYAMEGNDVEADDQLIHKWNRQLITGVIAPAYAKLLVEAGRNIPFKGKDELTTHKLFSFYDDLFPKNLKNLHKEWLLVAKATLRYISQRNLDVLPVVCQKGKGTQVTWHHVNTATSLAYFDDLSMQDNPQVVASAEVETKKTTPRSTILRAFLIPVGFKLLESSAELCQAFKSSQVQAEFVSPQAVVKHLLCNPLLEPSSSVPLTDTAFKDVHTFSTLFKYCLEGVTQPIELNGLPLRLTNDAKVGVFTTVDGLYVSSHCNVLPNLKQLFLHRNLVHLCLNWLYQNKSEDEAYTSGILKTFTISELAVHLGNYLPGDWQGCTHHMTWTPNDNGHPPALWIRNLWEFICSEMVENSQSCLQPIQDWPIFPTTSGKLVSTAMSKTVLFLYDFCDTTVRERFTEVLQKLGVPELDVKHMPMILSTLPEILKNYLALPVKPDSVVDVIKFMLDTDIEIGKLSLTESETLLRYLQEGCDSFSEENVQTMKMLNIFKLPDNNMTSLESYEHCHTMEGFSLLEVEAEQWMKHMNCVFLHPSRHLNLIHCKLGISPITHAEVYLKFILPSFNLLTTESKVSYLTNIKDIVLPYSAADVNEVIIIRLSQISFIPDGSGTLRTVAYFFDPENAIFKAMVDPNKLLPGKMRLLTLFLSQLGLHTKVTPELFVEFAKTIESKAKAVTSSIKPKELCEISKLLTAELQSNDSLHDAHFLRGIAEIKFIPSVPIKQELIDIHPAASDDRDLRLFIAYRGSMPEKYVELVWSVAKLLPRWSIPSNILFESKVCMHDCLGIQNKVVIDKALSHIQRVCCRMVEKNAIYKEDTLPLKVRHTFKNVMPKIFKYLQDNITEHGEELKRRLHHTALCLVDNGKVLIRADQMVLNMMDHEEEGLRPYLYKAPRELSEFDALYKFLGAETYCTFDQLAGVLSAIKTECKDECLGPNESKSALIAVTALFKIMKTTKGKCKISVSELYLPSSNNLLRKASHLYYADSHLMDQLKIASTDKEFVIPLKQCGFDVNDEVSLIELLPESLRPKNLGNEMHENVHEDNEDCPAGQDCPYLEHIKRMVNSVEMTRVLLRLLQHQKKDKAPDADETKSVEQLREFSNFCCKTELKLGFYDSNGALLTSRPKSVPAYLNRDNMTIFLEHMCPDKIIRSLTFKFIARCCGEVIEDLLDSEHLGFLQDALDCENPSEMNEVLCKSDIPEYGTSPRGSNENRQYRLGAVIPSDIRHLLDQDPYNLLHKGEIVGYECSLEDVSRAHESTASGSAETLRVESEHSSYEATDIVYAKIVEQIGESNTSTRLSKQYKIDIGLKGPIIVKVTALYKFLRPQEKPDLAVVSFTGDPTAEVPFTASNEQLPDIFENYLEKIREEINEAFDLPEEERKRAIRRLYRKWHPDKNPGRETVANEAFKFLKAEIGRHEHGSNYQEKYSQWENDVRRDREDARNYQRKYHDHFQRHGNRARENDSTGFVPPSFTRDTNRNSKRNRKRKHRHDSTDFGSPPFSKYTKLSPSARLCFQQAEEHLHNAEQTHKDLPTHVQWIAFQIHQAAEMALKAAQYSLDGRPDLSSNDLTYLARTVCQHRYVTSKEVLTLVDYLVLLGCDFNKPRQPDNLNSKTSGQAYKDFQSVTALKFCRQLLELIRDIIGI